jgi:hypothetical protein
MNESSPRTAFPVLQRSPNAIAQVHCVRSFCDQEVAVLDSQVPLQHPQSYLRCTHSGFEHGAADLARSDGDNFRCKECGGMAFQLVRGKSGPGKWSTPLFFDRCARDRKEGRTKPACLAAPLRPPRFSVVRRPGDRRSRDNDTLQLSSGQLLIGACRVPRTAVMIREQYE